MYVVLLMSSLPEPAFDCSIHFFFLYPLLILLVSLRVKCPGGTHHCPAKFILDKCFTVTPLWFVTAAGGETGIRLSSKY